MYYKYAGYMQWQANFKLTWIY